MKRQILISLILVSSILTMNAQWNGTSPIWTNSNIGIGTNDPGSQLELRDGSGLSVISSNAQIAFADNSSWLKLRMDNSGNLQLARYDNTPLIHFDKSGGIGIGTTSLSDAQLYLKDGGGISIQSSNAQIAFADNSSWLKLRMDNSGNLQITDSNNSPFIKFQPTSTTKLSVCGTMRANEVKVNLEGCDFVFEKDYRLRTLNEVELYIKENKRLPDMDSAEKMERDGTNLGEFNSKLLQKIEELTLYTIEQNKKIEQQNQAIENLMQVIKLQNEKIEKLESASK